MWALVQLFVDIAFHRRGPEEVPAEPFLLRIVAAVAVATGTVSLLLLGQGVGQALLESLLHLALFLGFYQLVLVVYGYAGRFRQTVSALLGTSVLLSLLAMPLLPTMARAVEQEEVLPGFGVLVLLGLLLWSLDIAAFIVSRALEKHYLVGVVIALAFYIIDTLFRELLARAG